MIVVDTSALIAILYGEPDAEVFTQAIFSARACLVAAPTLLEFYMVADGGRERATMPPRQVIDRPGIGIVPWTERHVTIARAAFANYGKGRGHPAQLNFGDCISYALAKAENAPLLYKGGDFALTDVRPAI